MDAPRDLQRRQTRRLAHGALLYAAAYGAVVLAWLHGLGVAQGNAALFVCALPALAALWARASGLLPVRNAIAKVLAVAMFGPLLLLFWAGEQVPPAVPGWPFFVPAVLLHAAVFVGTIVSLGQTMTRVEPAEGVPPVPAATLRRRLVALAGASPVSCTIQVWPGGTLVFELLASPAGDRHHRVLLDLRTDTFEVRVREQLGSAAARPGDAAEASMRGPGDPAVDATRPDADRVWAAVRQTTMLEPEQLDAVPLEIDGDAVRITGTPQRGEGVLLALCAVVIRSGWAWQPAWRGAEAAHTARA